MREYGDFGSRVNAIPSPVLGRGTKLRGRRRSARAVERAFGDADKVLEQLLRLPVAEERSGLPAPERNQVAAASSNRLFAKCPYQLALERIRQKRRRLVFESVGQGVAQTPARRPEKARVRTVFTAREPNKASR